MIAKICDRESRRELFFGNRLVKDDCRVIWDLMNGNASMHYKKEKYVQGSSGTRTMDFGHTEWMIGEQGRYLSATVA